MRNVGLSAACAAALLLLPAALWAQEAGDPRAGHGVARQTCGVCHAIEQGEARSPYPLAPPFPVIAAVPGMTSTALQAALLTSHRERTMPNLILPPDDLRNVIAYLLTLRR